MDGKIEDFKTGWYGISFGLSADEISALISKLEWLRLTKDHFHFRGEFKGDRGIADVEFDFCDKKSDENLRIQ